MRYHIISNNPLVQARYPAEEVVVAKDYYTVLCMVRDAIHEGARLLTHPQAGSVKPYETPYRSVLVSQDKTKLDFTSLQQIENAIERFTVLADEHPPKDWPQQVLDDFQLIDAGLVQSGVESLKNMY